MPFHVIDTHKLLLFRFPNFVILEATVNDQLFLAEDLRLYPWPWPRALLSLASRGSVLGRAVLGLGLGFFVSLASRLVSSTPPLWVSILQFMHD